MSQEPTARVAGLAFWRGKVDPRPLAGGMTNRNFVVDDAGRRYVVRVGSDVPVHGLVRAAEHAASRAAALAGISPAVHYTEPGILVLDFIEGRTLEASDIQARPLQQRLVPLVRRCHRDVPLHLRGPVQAFWVFHVLRDYTHTLRGAGHRHAPRLAEWSAVARRLEAAIGRIDLVMGHNDLLPANVIDDGKRLWLLDFDYAGFNSPLFDLGNLASNSELAEADQRFILEAYVDRPLDRDLWRQFNAMLTASLLREAMWSMVAELHPTVEMDFTSYTEENLRRFEEALQRFDQLEP